MIKKLLIGLYLLYSIATDTIIISGFIWFLLNGGFLKWII